MTRIFTFLALFVAFSSAWGAVQAATIKPIWQSEPIFSLEGPDETPPTFAEMIFSSVTGGGVRASLTNTGNGIQKIGAFIIEGGSENDWETVDGSAPAENTTGIGILNAGVVLPQSSGGLNPGETDVWFASGMTLADLDGAIFAVVVGVVDLSILGNPFSVYYNNAVTEFDNSTTAVPLPMGIMLLSSAGVGLWGVGRRKN